jgi:hypothetical protein
MRTRTVDMDSVHLGIPSTSKGQATILPATGEALRRIGKGELDKNGRCILWMIDALSLSLSY